MTYAFIIIKIWDQVLKAHARFSTKSCQKLAHTYAQTPGERGFQLPSFAWQYALDILAHEKWLVVGLQLVEIRD